jgi:hypothetical protein
MGFGAVELVLPQKQTLFASVIIPEARQGNGELPEKFKALVVVFYPVQLIQSLADFDKQDRSQMSRGVQTFLRVARLIQGAGGFDDLPPVLATFAAVQPIGVAGAAPIRNVLVSDEAPAEMFGENALNFRKAVEPFGQRDGEVAVFQLLVEFIANGFG